MESQSVSFRPTAYGRFGHVVTGILPLAGSILSGAGFAYSVLPLGAPSTWLIAMPLFVGSTWAFAYCLRFAFERGVRVNCTAEAIFYRGFLTSVSIPWRAITEVWINFDGRSPFVTLMLRTTKRRIPYLLNMSGLSPNYISLFSLVKKMTPGAKVWVPRGYEKLEAANGTSEQALYEVLVDSSLTLVRADGQNDARRSTQR